MSKKIEKPTWQIHAVFADEEDLAIGENFGNIHTHGLDAYGHRELCIPFWFDPEIAAMLLNNLGMDIANNGLKIKKGLIRGQLQNGFDLKAITLDGDNSIYIFIPDPNNKFYGDADCEEAFALQMEYAKKISSDKMNNK